MSAERWRIEEPAQEDVAGTPPTMVASLAYLWAALRRRWRTWVVGALAGLLIGAGAAAFMSPAASATVTLLVTHPDGTDPASAMQTDLSILRTRTVAERTVEALHSSTPPGIFQQQVQATAVTSTVLSIQVSAPDDAAAVKAAGTFATTYLAFRKTQMEAQSDALVAGYQNQIAAAQQQVETLTAQYNRLSGGGPATQAEAGDVLSRRSQLSAQILTLQQQISASRLATDSIAQASHVLDPARANDASPLRRAVLLGTSGLIGGLCLGVAIVLFGALTSFRLRRREEVALAVGVPVRYAAAGLRRGWRPGWGLGWGVSRPEAAHGRAVLVHGLATALRDDPRLAVVTIGQTAADDAALLVTLTGIELAGQHRNVVLVDLGERPRLAARLRRLPPAPAFAVAPAVAPAPVVAPVASEGPAVEPAEDPTEDTAEDPAEDPTEDTAEDTAEDPAEDPAEDTADLPLDLSLDIPLDIPLDLPLDLPLDIPLDLPAGDPAEDTGEDTGDIPLDLPLNLPADIGPAATPIPTTPIPITPIPITPTAPIVVRPEGVALLAQGPFADDTGAGSRTGEAAEAAATAEIVLSLFTLEPDTGADELPGWADRAVLVVKAGSATPEQLRTAADLLRSAGIEPAFVMLIGTDRTDESLGRPQLIGGAAVTQLYRSRS